jgi:hypothetical protein
VQNWIGIGVWIVLGVVIAMAIKVMIKRPEETPGHGTILAVLGAFGAVIGGMLGVGILEIWNGVHALSFGGMLGAVLLSTFISTIYRWGIRGLI